MPSLNASPQGLNQIKQCRKAKGWAIEDRYWLVLASQILDSSTDWTAEKFAEKGIFAPGISLSTWKRFLRGEPINARVFKAFCQILELDWQAVTNQEDEELSAKRNATVTSKCYQDWSQAPDSSAFCGRTDELLLLEQWIVQDQCHLVLVLGIGGAGKTALSVKLSEKLVGPQSDRFEAFIWRSLRNAPPLQTLLSELVLSLSNQTATLADSLEAKLSQLIELLHQQRCLLVLDNVESILQSGTRVGQYREGYEAYGEVFCRIADGRHQSSLILTSRERPRNLAARLGEDTLVRSLFLKGLSLSDGKQLLTTRGLVDSDSSVQHLMQVYSGNPLALKIAVATICSTFSCSIDEFLQQQTAVYGDIWDLLDQQFDRLSPLEQQIMYWLAIEREPLAFTELRENWLPPIAQRQLIVELESLQGRCLIETATPTLTEANKTRFTQQPVVMEYMMQKLIDCCCHEITTLTPNLFKSHALLKAQTQDYIRDTQVCLILQPLAEKLLETMHAKTSVEFLLEQLLSALRSKPLLYTGYTAGNIINLLKVLQFDLSDRDFSELAIAQAHLANVTLHRTNLTGSTFHQSSFTEMFGGVISVAFSPDGKCLAVGDARRDIHLWQLHNHQKLLTLKGHKSWVFSFMFSPSGRMLVSASDDYVVKLWDTTTGQCLQTIKGPANILNAITFSPDEQTIVWNEELAIRLWDIKHPEHQIASRQGYTLLARSTAFSPDGRAIAISSQDQTIKLWNIHTGECFQTLSGDTTSVRLVRFSSNGQHLASTSLDCGIRLWDVKSGQCLHVMKGHTYGVSELVFSPDNQYLASSSFDQTVKVWDVTTGQCLKTLYGHHKNLMACAFSPDGQYLVSGGGDHAVKLWDVATGQCLKTFQGYANGVTALAISNPSPIALDDASGEQQILASAHEDKTVKLWDLTTGCMVGTLPTQADLIWGVAFAPGVENILASTNADHTVKLWNWQTGECLQTLRHQNWGWSVAFHPDGQSLATGSYDQTIKLWKTQTGECLRTLQGHTSAVLSVAFSPSGDRLASSSHDKTIRIWHPETGDCVRILQGHGDRVWQIKFHADSQRLASGSYDETIKLWDIETGDCIRTFVGHDEAVTSICFSPDQQQLVSGSFDQTIKIWDIATGECLKTLRGHTGGILSLVCQSATAATAGLERPGSVEMGDCDSIIISSGFDGMIKLWHLEAGICVKSLIAPRPYEGMNITGVSGLTNAQRATLKVLGAIELD